MKEPSKAEAVDLAAQSRKTLEESAREQLRRKRAGMQAVMKRLEGVVASLPAQLAAAGAPDAAAIATHVHLAATSPDAAAACAAWFAKHKPAIEKALAAAAGTPAETLRHDLAELLGIPRHLWSPTWLLGGRVGVVSREERSEPPAGGA
jgi:hypothetical protein